MEATVVGAYDLGVLDQKLLKVLLEPYRGCDIDHGGSQDLKAKDGLEADDIIIKIMDPKAFEKLEKKRLPLKKHPKDWARMSAKQEAEHEEFYEARFNAVHKITKKKFGWS